MRTLQYLAIIFLLISCSDDNSNLGDDCPAMLVCTEEYRSYTVYISSNDTPVVLDSARTVNANTGKIHHFADNLFDDGVYVVLSDGQFNEVAKEGTAYKFEGYQNGDLTISEAFVFGHDCCHVIKIEGPESISL